MPKTRQNLSRVSQLRMSEDLYNSLEQLSLDEDRPMANMIRVLLAEAVHYRKIGMTKDLANRIINSVGKIEID